MALIECPECKRMISDKAIFCVGCGYPLNQNLCNKIFNDIKPIENKDVTLHRKKRIVEEIKGEKYDLTDILVNDDLNYDEKTRAVQEIANCGRPIALSIVFQYCPHGKFIDPDEDIVRCPKCGSTNITTGQRGYTVTTGLIGSGKTVNRCAKCGYRWEP